MQRYILALDQGTTSSRAILFGRDGSVGGHAQQPFQQYYPQPGWVEHDPTAILNTQIDALREVVRISGAPLDSIAAIGMTNQRETTLLWDRKTGRPLHNAIVWQCRRTAPIVARLCEEGLEEHFQKTPPTEKSGFLRPLPKAFPLRIWLFSPSAPRQTR